MLWCHILFLNNVRGIDFKQNTRFTAARSDLEFPNEGNPTFAKIPISPQKRFYTLDQLILWTESGVGTKQDFL